MIPTAWLGQFWGAKAVYFSQAPKYSAPKRQNSGFLGSPQGNFNHYSLLATVEAIFNLGTLGRNDTSATPIVDLFRGGIP